MKYDNRFTTKCTNEMMHDMATVAYKNSMSIAEYVRYCIDQDLKLRSMINKNKRKLPF